MMRKILTASEGIVLMIMFIAIAGLDGNGGDICGVIAIVSMAVLFLLYKVEENYEFGE